MYDLIVLIKSFFSKHKVRNLMLYIVLIILFVGFLNIWTDLFLSYKQYFIPENMAYAQLEDKEIEDKFLNELEEKGIKYYKTVPMQYDRLVRVDVHNLFSSDLYIDLEDMTYSKEAPVEEMRVNQKQIDRGHSIQNPGIMYNFVNTIVNKEKMILPNFTYQIDEIITGSYPKDYDDVLIGENMANYYMSQKGIKDYNTLLGQKVDIKTVDCDLDAMCINSSFEISGIYRNRYTGSEIEENFIINPTEEIKDAWFQIYEEESNTPGAYFLESSDEESLKEMASYGKEYYHIFLTDEDLKPPAFIEFHFYFMGIILMLILCNIFIFINFYKQLKIMKMILNYYVVNKLIIIFIYLLPFLVLNLFFLLIYLII